MFDPSQLAFTYPQPPLISSSEPFPNFGPHSLTHLGFQPPPNPNPNPNPAWIVTHPVTQPGIDATLLATTNPNSFWVNQPATSNGSSLDTNAVQSMRCDICDVDCANRDVFEKHFQGKKHSNILQRLTQFSAPPHRNQMGEHFMFVAPTVSCSPQLEMKKKKVIKGGTALNSVRVCTVCNVVCNSQDVFYKHMTGRKHAAMVSLASLGEAGQCFAVVRAQFESNYKKPTKKVKVVQFAWCQVCQINCNSKDAYAIHLSGKKHLKNIEQLRNSTSVPITGSEENSEAKQIIMKATSKKASREEMEAKKQKVVEAGAATGAIRTCTICNVVCNSRTVFESHLGGQKHKDMLKKSQESGM